MPSFLSDLRRRSRHSGKSSDPSTATDSASNSGGSHDGTGEGPVKKQSMSNIASHFKSAASASQISLAHFSNGNKTPPSAKTPPLSGPRPALQAAQSGRYSLAGSPHVSSSPRVPTFTSTLAPVVNSISDGSWVHQKILLVSGTLNDSPNPLDGQITVHHQQDHFPPTQWPVCDNHFKALVHLQPGPNRLRLEFVPHKRPSSSGNQPHTAWININYLPMNSSPPLQLVILVAKDSPLTYDAVPERVRTEGNGLDTAVRKFRMAAYLWQAFTGEQMNRHGFGRRCFRFDEEWQPGTSSSRDLSTHAFRNEAKVHIVRLDQTVDEIRGLELAQQHEGAKADTDLFGIAIEACKKYFAFRDGQKQYVSALYLDSHWDKSVGTIRGHAALGGGAGGLSMAIFGSHALQSYPAHIEEVVSAFTDVTRTDTDFVADDCNESGSNWEAANIGIGAHLHETGHLFGCPHQEHGIMLRDYVHLNRTFTTREPYSTRTKQDGLQLCQTTDECVWHRLDALRFRFHPCFALPSDQFNSNDDSVQIWAVDGNAAMITSPNGIAWLEIRAEGEDLCHAWIEYVDAVGGPNSAPRQVTLTEQDLRTRMRESDKNKKIQIKVFSCGQGDLEVKDFSQLVGKSSRTKLPDGRTAFRGSKLGTSSMEGSQPEEVVLQSAHISTKLLVNVRVFHGFAVDGIEFMYEDGTSQLFGKRGGKPGGDDFTLDTRRGETIIGYYVRSGGWLDGIQILTSTGRRSPIYGNPIGGSGCTLIPPRGYTAVGVYGSCAGWLDGFGLIISR